MHRKLTLLFLAAVVFCSSASAADPTLTVILPRGVQQGTEATLRFSGARLNDAEEIFFYEPGLTVLGIEAKDANNIDVKVKVAEDCPLGEHTAQVRCRSGISDYRTFFVGALPIVEEAEPNTEFSAPQAIEQNVTVHGTVQNEDVDFFAVTGKQGERLSVEVEGMRFGQTLFDPYIAILNSDRFVLASADDTALLRQDAALSVTLPEDGTYIIEMRDSGYGGNGNCRYRLHIGSFPRPSGIFPAGGQAGTATQVTFLGNPDGELTTSVTPDSGVTEMPLFAADDRGVSPSPHTFRVSPDPNALEVEPNNSLKDATVVTFPSTMNGVLETPGDVDCFRFAAKKGQRFEVECYGRRIRSPIDPVMNLYGPDGKGIAGNDDSRGPDSYLRFDVPADGEYTVRITDHLGSGGSDYVYRVEFQPVNPSLKLGIPRLARYSQTRQQIHVPRGGRFATIISAARQNFGGDLVLEDLQLPDGMTMTAFPMPSNMSTMPVVFEAKADAPLSGSLVDFRARLNDETKQIAGRFENRADFVIAQPGQSLYAWKDVDRLPFAVIDELPFTIDLVQPTVPIVRDGSMQLKVMATKKEGWDEEIRVQFPFRPPGLGATSTIKIPKGQTEAVYPINANSKAAIGTWPVYALGYANVGGNAWTSSPMRQLEIAEPYVGLALQRSAVEQGQATQVVANVTLLKELSGPAKVKLMGLPHKVTAPELEILPDTKELVFDVTTEGDSPAGTHKNIFCQVVVTENNASIVHARVGYTELRVDKPLPKPVEQPKPAVAETKPQPTPAAAKPKPEVRLTRLQQLRKEAEERRAARKAAAAGQQQSP